MSPTAVVSPSDKLTKQSKARQGPGAGLASIKIDFEKGVTEPSGEVVFKEPVSYKIYSETKEMKSFDIKDCVEPDQAILLMCQLCQRFPSVPVMSSVCGHIFCKPCFVNFKTGVKTSICPGSGRSLCGEKVTVENMAPLTGIVKALHSSIHIHCRNPSCDKNFCVGQIEKHVKSCKKRGPYEHRSSLREARSNIVNDRVGDIFTRIDEMCEDKNENSVDVLFNKLVQNLRSEQNNLYIDVDKIYKEFIKGRTESLTSYNEADVMKAVALKSKCNLTVGQYRSCRGFCVENGTGENVFVSYEKVLKSEEQLDAGNVDYNIVDIISGEIVANHEAVRNSVIDVDEDIGCNSYEMMNPNIEGNRVSLIDSVCKEVQDLYPDLKRLCSEKYPDMDLSKRTLVARTKLGFDGTSSTVKSDKAANRLEVPSWLRGTLCIISVDVLMDDGSEAELFSEPSPNSGEANNIILLWKADENNLATVSIAMSIYDEECKIVDNSMFDIQVEPKDNHEIMMDENENTGQVECSRQKLKIIVDKPKDEKFARNCHHRAGAGSTFPCTYCKTTRTDASAPPFSGEEPITLTNRLEKEAGIYITQNPSQKNQKNILEVSIGQKGEPFTTAEPLEEPMDVLHEDINIVGPLFVIGSRILHFGNQQFPQYTYVKASVQKIGLEQSEAQYMAKLLKFCPTIPEVTQMPGNFCREFCAEENKTFILNPLPECQAKADFAHLMDLWRKIRSTHKKSKPTDQEIKEYPKFVKQFLEDLDSKFSWFKPLPNQFHRIEHNSFFLQNDRNSLGVKSLEGLEKGNYTTKIFDNLHTYKGDRKKANRGVFKLLRLKSNRTLRMYMIGTKRVQRCSKCKNTGHNSSSIKCPVNVDLSDLIEEDDEDEMDQEDVNHCPCTCSPDH